MVSRLESSAEEESYLPAIGRGIAWFAYRTELLLRGGIKATGGTARGVTRVLRDVGNEYRNTMGTVYPGETNLNTSADTLHPEETNLNTSA